MRAALCLLLTAAPAAALDPAQVAVLANKSSAASREVAAHYMAARGIPAANLVALDLPDADDISRADYDSKLAGPLREALRGRKDDIRCVVAVYGVPLRVAASTPTAAEAAQLKELEGQTTADAEERRVVLSHRESQAAVDSELMLLWHPPYPLARWRPNPLHWQFPAAKRAAAPPTLMTARLDGPTPAVAKRLVDDAVAVEKAGLTGKAYIDARGLAFDPKAPTENGGYGFGGYDQSFREAAELLKAGGLDVTLDDKDSLFADNSCPDAALYAGWYSVGQYKPCCTFARGAVAWHLASYEAVTLRSVPGPNAKLWCPNLLLNGVAATLGPVSEPYTVGFPKPAEFFGFLATGKYTLAECYAKTVVFSSWQMVLVGDPLYNPYKATPKVKEADVKSSPRGGAFLFR